MSHDFSETRLRTMLRSSKTWGYRPIFYGEEDNQTEPFILWRHDIDIEIPAALRFARLEAEEGIHSTYFFMNRSWFYNLFSHEAERAIEEIVSLGHQVGLHCNLGLPRNAQLPSAMIEQKVEKDFQSIEALYGPGIFQRIVSFHNPPAAVLKQSFSSFYSTYQEKFFGEIKYLSDSNRHWREGSPETWLEKQHLSRYSILLHPVIWSHPGSTMPEWSNSFLDNQFKIIRDQLILDDVHVESHQLQAYR